MNKSRFVLSSSLAMRHGWNTHMVYRVNFHPIYWPDNNKSYGLLKASSLLAGTYWSRKFISVDMVIDGISLFLGSWPYLLTCWVLVRFPFHITPLFIVMFSFPLISPPGQSLKYVSSIASMLQVCNEKNWLGWKWNSKPHYLMRC